jgi:hypothetical protein
MGLAASMPYLKVFEKTERRAYAAMAWESRSA